jgi:hypothetical protein
MRATPIQPNPGCALILLIGAIWFIAWLARGA